MRILSLTILLFCLLGFSCEDENKDDGNIQIKTGRVCGWCGGGDTLAITKIKTSYVFENPCDETKNKEREDETDREKWSELISTLNWNEFTQVNVNTCALCADGCDTWILIQNKDVTHQIRYTENSPEIEPVRTFVEKLDALRDEYRQN